MSAVLRIQLLAILLLASVRQATAAVELVLVFHRHGARTPLYKNATTLAEGGAQLTLQGEAQLLKIGQTFRGTYIDPHTCGTKCITGLEDGRYDATNIRVISSSFDRTLASAASFLQGVYPANTTNTALTNKPIPVYSVFGSDDYLIRAYGNCPAFLQNTKDWFKSQEFAVKEAQVAGLLQLLSSNLKQNVTLMDFYNTYDDLQTQRDANLRDLQAGTGNVTYDDVIWSQALAVHETVASLQALLSAALNQNQTFQIKVLSTADWLETNRYSRRFAKNLCGGTLMSEILIRLEAATVKSQPAAERLIEYSAHYPTLMCILASIPDLDTSASSFTSKIPNYGAALIFELHLTLDANNTMWAVSLRQQDGSEAEYVTVELPCASPAASQVAGNQSACMLQDFQELVAPEQFEWQSNWCTACNNSAMPACYSARKLPGTDRPSTYVEGFVRPNTAAIQQAQQAAEQDMTANPKECFQQPQMKISLAAIFGFLGGALLASGLTYYSFCRRLGHKQPYLAHSFPSGTSSASQL